MLKSKHNKRLCLQKKQKTGSEEPVCNQKIQSSNVSNIGQDAKEL